MATTTGMDLGNKGKHRGPTSGSAGANQFQLPIIDLSGNDTAATAHAVVEAARRYGFLYVKNWEPVLRPPRVTGTGTGTGTEERKDGLEQEGQESGLSKTEIDHIFNLSSLFFGQPDETKAELRINLSKNGGDNYGWSAFGHEDLDPSKGKGKGNAKGQSKSSKDGVKKVGRTGDPKEAFNICQLRPIPNQDRDRDRDRQDRQNPTQTMTDQGETDEPLDRAARSAARQQPQQPLGPVLSPHRSEISDFSRHCQDLCLHILRLFAIGLEIEGDDDPKRETDGPDKHDGRERTTEPGLGGGGGDTHDDGDIPRTGADWFSYRHDPRTGPSGTILRLLFYPGTVETIPEDQTDQTDQTGQERTPISRNKQDNDSEKSEEEEEDTVRAGAHSDYGSITLLFQRPGQPGLQVLLPHDLQTQSTDDSDSRASTSASTSASALTSSWLSVQVNPENAAVPPILINVGDLLSFWTDGYLRSTVHRVITPTSSSTSTPDPNSSSSPSSPSSSHDRYSIAYFCHPANSTPLTPVPSPLLREYQKERQNRIQGLDIPVDPSIRTGPLTGGEGVITAEEHLRRRLEATYL